MSVINYFDVIGVFTENGQFRLDIGSGALSKNTPADHSSWATRLVIKSPTGKKGLIDSEDVIGIYSADERYRLDIGSDAVCNMTPCNHKSWATQLVIRNLDDPSINGPVFYGDRIGIFSIDQKYRLDIGDDVMKKNTPASHDSWATRLNLQPTGPASNSLPKKWPITTLTYSIQSTPPTNFQNITGSETYESLIINAFNEWGSNGNFTFTRIAGTGTANIDVFFVSGSSKYLNNLIGRADGPTLGRIFLNDDKVWSDTHEISDGTYNLQSVALHEIGHVLGLRHVPDVGSVMYPGYQNITVLDQETKTILNQLYPS